MGQQELNQVEEPQLVEAEEPDFLQGSVACNLEDGTCESCQ